MTKEQMIKINAQRAAAMKKRLSTTAVKTQYKLPMTDKEAIVELTSGTNTGIIDRLTSPVYDTITLTATDKDYYPFSIKRGDNGKNYGETNNQDGGVVPAKQKWTIDSLGVSVFSPTALTDANLALLAEVIFNFSVRMKIDDSPKFEVMLSDILNMPMLVQAAAATGSNGLQQTCYSGKFKLVNKLVMGAQTNYELHVEKMGGAIPAALAGVKIRFTMGRTQERLV